jgi:hypothetical protein
VHSPADVPVFDPSRGGDPFHGSTLRTADGIAFLSHDLGGNDGPPRPMWKESVDTPPGHVVGRNYPRLARLSPFPPPDQRVHMASGGPLEALAGLHSIVVQDGFMSEASRVAAEYGPLGYSERSFTLTYWRETAAELHAYLSVLGRLSQIEMTFDRNEWDGYLQQELKREIPQALASLPGGVGDSVVQLIERAGKGHTTMKLLRNELSAAFWSEFAHETKEYAHPGAYWRKKRSEDLPLKPLVSLEVPGQFTVRCGARGWSFQQLWDEARRGAMVVFCVTCGRPMLVSRADHRYCSSSCRSRASRRRTRIARASSKT